MWTTNNPTAIARPMNTAKTILRTSEHDLEGRYVDFREHPELIESTLEDFRPFERHNATRRFYAMLKWINGSTFELETNDCLLRSPQGNASLMEIPIRHQIQGRVTVLFRDYRLNTSEPMISWFTDSCAADSLQKIADLRSGPLGIADGLTASWR